MDEDGGEERQRAEVWLKGTSFPMQRHASETKASRTLRASGLGCRICRRWRSFDTTRVDQTSSEPEKSLTRHLDAARHINPLAIMADGFLFPDLHVADRAPLTQIGSTSLSISFLLRVQPTMSPRRQHPSSGPFVYRLAEQCTHSRADWHWNGTSDAHFHHNINDVHLDTWVFYFLGGSLCIAG